MKLTKNFNSYEFDCESGELVPQKYFCHKLLLASTLQVIRTKVGNPIIINSAFRTIRHNKKVGGSINSYHLKCMAVDIYAKNTTLVELYNIIDYLQTKGLIVKGFLKMYKTHIHLDVRGRIVR